VRAAARRRSRPPRRRSSNLAQLASDAPRASAAPSPSHGGGHVAPGAATGPGGGEGSGLIDIRSMASAYLGGDRGGAKPASGGIGSIDDLPVFASTAFNEPAVLMPTPGSRASNNKLLYMLIGLVGVLAIVAVVMVVIVLKGGDEKTAASVAVAEDDKDKDDKDSTEPGKGSATDTAKPDTTTATDPPKPDTTTATDPAKPDTTTATDPPKPDTSKPDTAKPERDRPRPDSSRPKPDRPKPDPKPDTTVAKPDSGGSCDEVSCVLSNYEGSCCAKYKKGKKGNDGGGSTASSGGRSDLPESLDRNAVAAGVAQVKARVQACGGKSSAKGEVKVSVKVSPDGKVTSTSIKNTPDAALGSCVENAMSKATFAKTQKGGSFAYPWKF
jgi:outer membrane biosynthesis protein TonB